MSQRPKQPPHRRRSSFSGLPSSAHGKKKKKRAPFKTDTNALQTPIIIQKRGSTSSTSSATSASSTSSASASISCRPKSANKKKLKKQSKTRSKSKSTSSKAKTATKTTPKARSKSKPRTKTKSKSKTTKTSSFRRRSKPGLVHQVFHDEEINEQDEQDDFQALLDEEALGIGDTRDDDDEAAIFNCPFGCDTCDEADEENDDGEGMLTWRGLQTHMLTHLSAHMGAYSFGGDSAAMQTLVTKFDNLFGTLPTIVEDELPEKIYDLFTHAYRCHKKRDYNQARLFFEIAAKSGHLESCFQYGKYLSERMNLPKKAAQYFYRAAARGHPGAQVSLGSCYFVGRGIKRDRAKATYWFRKAASYVMPTPSPSATSPITRGGPRASPSSSSMGEGKQAERYREHAAEGMYLLSNCLLLGNRFTPSNPLHAAAWLRKSCSFQHAEALVDLATYMLKGRIADEGDDGDDDDNDDDEKAKSVSKSNITITTNGRKEFVSVSKSTMQKCFWLYHCAATTKNYPLAMTQLGLCYQHGIGYGIQPTKAVDWYLMAAKKSCPMAVTLLGQCYLQGFGIEPDRNTAFLLFNKAAAMEDEHAAKILATFTRMDTRNILELSSDLSQDMARFHNMNSSSARFYTDRLADYDPEDMHSPKSAAPLLYVQSPKSPAPRAVFQNFVKQQNELPQSEKKASRRGEHRRSLTAH